MRVIGVLLLLSLFGSPARATRSVENYPKLLAYSMAVNLLPEAVQDTLSWYDVLNCHERPETIGSLRQKNPNQRYLWTFMPQYVEPFEDPNPWWMPDTLWSITRLSMVYAKENDWYLKDTNGQPITAWGHTHYLLNWTEHCPAGTFGTSKGMRVAEWMARVALPTIALSQRYWDPWDWDSQTAYNGYMFEILADCLGSYGWQDYAQADPDQDGQAEGVYSTCSTGGTEDPLTVLFRAENEIFFQWLDSSFPDDFIFLINENNTYIGPDWLTELSGMKLENWMREGTHPSWHDWWDWFYGLTPPWLLGENWGAGYAWAEASFDSPVADERIGWDVSFIETWRRDSVPESENLRQMRWGLGTSMLGDGYFAYTYDQRYPYWQPEFDFDFGNPFGDFTRELYGADTLYVRLFTKGMVEVNPYPSTLNGIPERDSRFTFWLPVEDLAVEPIDEHTVRAEWTAPIGDYNQADSYELRYSTVPLTLENWGQADSYPGNPVVVNPGALASVEVVGLTGGQTYNFAVRTRTRGRLEPLLSNAAQADLEEPVDTTPPGTITGLTLTGAGETWIDLAWTATGDDGESGMASFYFLRHLIGEPIENEEDWARGVQADSLPIPGPPGSAEEYRLEGLSAGESYGIAVRARDDAGNLSPLHGPFIAQTADPPPPVDDIPPAAIADLAGESTAPGTARLTWSAPGDDQWEGEAALYEIRLRLGSAIETEQDWSAAQPITDGIPDPGPPHSTDLIVLTSLSPGFSYGFAVRARDDEGNLAGLSNPILVAIEEEPPPPDIDTTPPAAVDDLNATSIGDTFAVLQWTAPGDDGHEGIASAYDLRLLLDEPILDEESWSRASQVRSTLIPKPAPAGTVQQSTLGGLLSGRTYGIALRALDDAENIAPLGTALLIETTPTADIDETPPEAIHDLSVGGAETTRLLLTWTAPEDNDASGRADRYLLRIAPDGTEEEQIWEIGQEVAGLPDPGEGGTVDSVWIGDLAPSSRYGFVLRSADEAGNISDPSNATWGTTQSPSWPVPPAAIDDLSLIETGSDTARVGWTAPGDDGRVGRATRYHVRIRSDGGIESEEDWGIAASPDTAGLGRPAEAGSQQSWVVRGLEPSTRYALAIRAEDDSALLGALSIPFVWKTAQAPLPDPPGPIADLSAGVIGENSCELSWSAPASLPSRTESVGYRLAVREGSAPIEEEEDWASAVDRSEGLPDPGPPGSMQAHTLTDLEPGITYAIALRAEDALGRLGALAPGIVVTTAAPADSIEDPEETDSPPAAITDLTPVEIGTDYVDLTWTAVGEDSTTGNASEYQLRVLEAEDFTEEGDWERATPVESILPVPAPAGTAEAYRLTGLEAGQFYGIALRVLDATGQISPWAGGIGVDTPGLPPPRPDPVEGFEVVEVAVDQVVLEWFHPEDPGGDAGPYRYSVGLSDVPITPANWEQTDRHPDPPSPGPAGTTIRLVWEGLDAEQSYWVAVQVESSVGLSSILSPVLPFVTPPYDLAPPDPPAAIWIERRDETGSILLAWEPSPSPDVAGYHIYGRGEMGGWTQTDAELLPPSSTRALVEPIYTGFALTAVDDAGNEGNLSSITETYASSVTLRGPFPHPILGSCRFEIELPASAVSQPVHLRVHDLRGRTVRHLVDALPGPGGYLEIRWDRSDDEGLRLAPGFYLVTLEGEGIRIDRRIFLSP